jgi:hypothetical protein
LSAFSQGLYSKKLSRRGKISNPKEELLPLFLVDIQLSWLRNIEIRRIDPSHLKIIFGQIK